MLTNLLQKEIFENVTDILIRNSLREFLEHKLVQTHELKIVYYVLCYYYVLCIMHVLETELFEHV